MNKKKKKVNKKYVLTFVKKGEKKNLKLYRVVWTDHAMNSMKWTPLDEIKTKSLEMISTGFQVDENDKSIALAMTVSDGGTVNDVLTIVKSCIISKTQL